MIMSGSAKRQSFWRLGRRMRVMTLLRRRAILRLVIVKSAPKTPPRQPRAMAGRNMITFTGMALPACGYEMIQKDVNEVIVMDCFYAEDAAKATEGHGGEEHYDV